MKKLSVISYSALLLSSPLFSAHQASENRCRCQLQGEPLCKTNGAYNLPAAIALQNCSKYHYFFDASFIYWYAAEQGLDLGANGVLNTAILYNSVNSSTLSQSFEYKPGFKVGAGMVGDHNWVLHVEYTWYRGKMATDSKAPPASQILTAGVATTTASSGVPVWVVDDWFLQGSVSGQALAASRITSSWKIAMDLIDATAGRPYYQAPHLVISPFGGLRAAFIRQSMTIELTEAVGQITNPSPQPIGSRNTSHAWGIGPRFGMDLDVLLCAGFRLAGDLAASLLYMQYTKVGHSEDAASTDFNPGPYRASYTDYGTLRPIAELGLGVGWGKYIYNSRYHIDFSADYDFSYFWDQNMIRKLLDDTLAGIGSVSSSLYFQGLTLTSRFDF